MYNSPNTRPCEMDGSDLPFSQATKVFGLICNILATSACVSPAFTLAAAKLILKFSNRRSPPFL
nr:MAG TPA: hypothetical protein [Bacteriophage sp.]